MAAEGEDPDGAAVAVVAGVGDELDILGGEVLLRDLSTRTCSGYYESLRTRKGRLGKSFSVDSHRNILAEARSFLRWCSTKRRWISQNPLEAMSAFERRSTQPQTGARRPASSWATASTPPSSATSLLSVGPMTVIRAVDGSESGGHDDVQL